MSTVRLFSANHDNPNISSLVPISNISASSEKVLWHVSVDFDRGFDRDDSDDFDRDDSDDFDRDDSDDFDRDDSDNFDRDDSDNFDRGNSNDFDRNDSDDIIMLHGCMGIVICVFAMVSPPFILLLSPCLIVILRALLHILNLFAIFSPIIGADASQSIIAFTVIPAIWTRTVNKGS